MHRFVIALAALLALVPAADARVAFTSSKGITAKGARVLVANDDGTGITALGVRGSRPAISPDGTRVAYVAGPIGEGTSLRIRTIATGAEVVAEVPFGGLGDPLWSPDGTRLLVPTDSADAKGFVTGEGLSLVDAATGAATAIVAPKGNEVTGYSWAPSGAQFAYARSRWAGRVYSETIRIANVDGTIARTVGAGSNPLWGPARLVFQRHTSERWHGMTVYHAQLWLADPTTQLSHYPAKGMVAGPWAGYWAPDGSMLYGGIGGEDYALPGRVSATTGRFTPYRDASGATLSDAFPAGISADGATLLMRTGVIEGREQVKLMPAAGGAMRSYIRDVLEISTTPSWQP